MMHILKENKLELIQEREIEKLDDMAQNRNRE